MSSPRLQKQSDFDATIGRELQSWAARQQPPAGGRARLLAAASAQSPPAAKHSPRRRMKFFTQAQRWLTAAFAGNRNPQMPYSELSQWLFNQAMWHNLGNDRRAARLVC